MTDDLSQFDLAQQVFAQQAFSQFLGAEMTVFESGKTEIRLPMRAELRQQNGFAHGGAISYLADTTLAFAGGSVLGERVVTSEFKINYLKPARGKLLIGRATVLGQAGRQAVCRCDIFALHAGKETLCATALGTIVTF